MLRKNCFQELLMPLEIIISTKIYTKKWVNKVKQFPISKIFRISWSNFEGIWLCWSFKCSLWINKSGVGKSWLRLSFSTFCPIRISNVADSSLWKWSLTKKISPWTSWWKIDWMFWIDWTRSWIWPRWYENHCQKRWQESLYSQRVKILDHQFPNRWRFYHLGKRLVWRWKNQRFSFGKRIERIDCSLYRWKVVIISQWYGYDNDEWCKSKMLKVIFPRFVSTKMQCSKMSKV